MNINNRLQKFALFFVEEFNRICDPIVVFSSIDQYAAASYKPFIDFLFTAFRSHIFGQTNFFRQLADSSVTLKKQYVTYDPSYFRINYPKEDLPSEKAYAPM